MDPATRLRLGELLGVDVTAAQALGGQHGVRHYRLSLADGRMAGVPAVLAETTDYLVIEWIGAQRPSLDTAGRFGRELAGLHAREPTGSARPGLA